MGCIVLCFASVCFLQTRQQDWRKSQIVKEEGFQAVIRRLANRSNRRRNNHQTVKTYLLCSSLKPEVLLNAMKQIPKKPAELFWPKVVLKKWLNIKSQEPDFSADEGGDSDGSEKEEEVEYCESDDNEENGDDKLVDEASLIESNGFEAIPRLRRRNSETFRTQYINTKELRVCVGTWNLGGTLPPENLDIKDWLETDELADIYVIGLQEMVPLNASNIFGAEDHRPIPMWENIIREALNKKQPPKPKFKSYSAPSSPSKFNGIIDIEDELLNETDSDDCDDEIYHSYDEEIGNDEVMTRSETDELNTLRELELEKQFSSPKRFDRLNCLKMEDEMKNSEASAVPQQKRMLTKTLSGIEKIGLNWPEPPSYFRSVKSFRDTKSFRTCNSFRPSLTGDRKSSEAFVKELSLESIRSEKKPPFVRIVSKQMVGIFISIWVRRSLRRHIQKLKISTVGVGVMGYIGNKGSVSVSMSIYQTPFCFICTHLTSGEKEGDELKRNADVHEIHRRTQFRTVSGIGLPKVIHDHERIIWLGDLNYRISLPYDKTRELISKKEWPKLLEHDQLVRELKKGCAFDGWTEGILNFPPTYKYEQNSEKYCGADPKAGRRNPAWCDRILSFGKGMRLLNYKRIENKLSDHRPVTAIYMAEVEVFSHRKLQKALTFTDAELEEDDLENIKFNIGLSRLRYEENLTDRER